MLDIKTIVFEEVVEKFVKEEIMTKSDFLQEQERIKSEFAQAQQEVSNKFHNEFKEVRRYVISSAIAVGLGLAGLMVAMVALLHH